MTSQDFIHLFDGLAGVAALFLGYQVRQAVRSINKVVVRHEDSLEDHEDRLERLEKRKRGAGR